MIIFPHSSHGSNLMDSNKKGTRTIVKKKVFFFMQISLLLSLMACVVFAAYPADGNTLTKVYVLIKKVILKSPLTGIPMKVKIVTCRSSSKKIYKTTYFTYGDFPLPLWTTVQYIPKNKPQKLTSSNNWLMFNKFKTHNTVLNLKFPSVSWVYRQHDAISLRSKFPAADVLGKTRAAVMFTQFVGDAVGVSYANGIIYIPSNDNRVYAVNAKTGKLIWSATTAGSVMSVPLVAKGVVYVTIGNAAFSGASGPFAVLTHNLKHIRRGDGYGGVYAFSAYTGELLWVHFTAGEIMPTALYLNHKLIFANGSGHIYALNAKTGKTIWKKYAGVSAFDSMSSANYYNVSIHKIFNREKIGIIGFTFVKPPYGELIAFNIQNGKFVWKAVLPKQYKPFNTGMGDVSPAVDQKNNLVIQDTIVNYYPKTKKLNTAIVAVQAASGKIKWVDLLGEGYAPPAFKGGVPMIHHGIIYVGSPVTSKLYAIKELNGKIIWSSKIPTVSVPPKSAGGGRGNPIIVGSKLILAAGAYLFTYNAETGKLLKRYYVGGRFGLVNPVVVGKTLFVDNSYNDTFAVPLKKLL